ncbi:hypothetical protein [Spiroplasma endosymbiont of Aspidapion aeneum]|uniref:hypothetical protein n=1 Tax=Spiroplasma endosymbiont of Aspidapion aeneum TaxID=3066276 RepID=UPI00313E7B3C
MRIFTASPKSWDKKWFEIKDINRWFKFCYYVYHISIVIFWSYLYLLSIVFISIIISGTKNNSLMTFSFINYTIWMPIGIYVFIQAFCYINTIVYNNTKNKKVNGDNISVIT